MHRLLDRLRTALALLPIVVACQGDAPERDGRPNLVLVSLDTCRADRLSCYGAERQTPNIDRLAAESVQFDDCLAQSCVTAPSHMSLFTGHYVHRHGLKKNGLVSEPPYTLASLLRDAGWRTAAFTGHGSLQAKYGHGFGFETFESWVGEERPPYQRNLDESLPPALEWLDEHEDEPFFLLVHGYDPHCPYWPPPKWRKEYADWYDGKLRPQGLCGPPMFLGLIERGIVGAREVRYVNDLYDAEIASADERVGELLDELEHRGLLDESIVVFLSDHGESLGTRDRIGHGAMLEEILHVPLLIRFPGGQWAGRRDDPVELVDVMPTLLSALGVPLPEGIHGRDLLPSIRGGADADGARLRVAQANDNYAVRFDRDWKITFGFDEDGTLMRQALYNVAEDPLETRDLFGTPAGRARFDRMLDRFLSWRELGLAEDRALYGGGARTDYLDSDQRMLDALGYTGDDDG